MSLIGIHTAFDGTLGVDLLRELVGMRYTLHRMEALDCDDATMVEMVRESVEAGAVPLVVIWDTARLPHLSGRDAEWKNELDGDIPPEEYRRDLDEAVRIAVEHGVRLWGGVISNLDGDSLKWLNDVKGDGWPAGLHGVTAHRYGDGSFDDPHRGFSDRDAEVKWLRIAAAGLPIAITEFGYPDTDLTEQQCAERIAQEWEFWGRHRIPAYLYQLGDGIGPGPINHMGIRRIEADGSWAWKPCAFVVPQSAPIHPPINPPQEHEMFATFTIRKSYLRPDPDKPDFFTALVPGRGVVSINPATGGVEFRPEEAHGAHEEFYLKDNRCVFPDVAGLTFDIPYEE